ncbi:MAG TPA: RtcB family protein [Chloroflexota bacterium]|nr:RtcB family protein [Chloroflexota bacterium]
MAEMISGAALQERGWTPGPLLGQAKKTAARLLARGWEREAVLDALDAVRMQPLSHEADLDLGGLAAVVLADMGRQKKAAARISFALRADPIPYRIWGREGIDAGAMAQMDLAMRLPSALAGALMADAHIGYGLPVGGAFALDDEVSPGAVGPDIGCSVYLTIFDAGTDILDDARQVETLRRAIGTGTVFGVGARTDPRHRPDHAVLDDPAWHDTPLTRSLQGKGVEQLGQSGSGNHFVSVGAFELLEAVEGVPPGRYVVLASHSGSRGVGYRIADVYGKRAEELHRDVGEAKKVAALSLAEADGQEYWAAMQLALRFARANHEIIHARVGRLAGLRPLAFIGNPHNVASRETVRLADGTEREAIVHRKGATPAHADVLGFIPGTMADPGFLTRGLGVAEALQSASHGAGRRLGRRQALQSIPRAERDRYLAERGVTLLGGGIDEAPQAYKDIAAVMAAQADLVDIVGRFHPRIVRMADEEGGRRKARPADGE